MGRSNRCRNGRGLARRAGAVRSGFESLEPRLCMTTFEYVPLGEYLDISAVIAEVSAPSASGAVNFGVSVAGLGDIDGDGVPDFAIGADGDPSEGGEASAGQVFVFSGKTRELIRTLSDGSIGFGRALANLGDVDGDGVPDLAIGSPNRSDTTGTFGAVAVYSGADGAMLWEVAGDGPDGELGRALAAVLDVDSDGVVDVAVGGRVGGKGEVRILSGASGGLIATLSEGSTNESYGSALAAMPGTRVHNAILAVGAPRDGNGKVYTYADGWSSAFTYSGQWTNGAFGTAVTMFGPYLAVGAPDAVVSAGVGVVVMFDLGGPYGMPDAAHVANPKSATDHFGGSLADVGDLNGDGLPDLAAGLRDETGAGSVRLITFRLDGHGGYEARDIASTADVPLLGGALANVGDVDGDGMADLLTGAARPGVGEAATTLISLLPTVWGAPASVGGGTSNLSWLWPAPLTGNSSSTRIPYLIHNNRLVTLAAVPGLLASDQQIIGISDDGAIAVVRNVPGLSPVYTYIRNGQRLTIDEAITSTVGGGIDFSLLVPALVGPGGHILFNVTHPTIREATSAWVLDPDGTLRFLWNGTAADVNASGMVVGARFLPNDASEPVLYSGGGVTVIAGLGGAQAINSAGDVAGWDGSDEVVIIKNGVRTVVGHVNPLADGSGSVTWFSVTSLDNAGRILGLADFPAQQRQTLYFGADSGLILADPNIVGAPAGENFTPLGIDAAGNIVGYSFALVPIDDRAAFGARDQGTEVVVSGSGGTQIVATNIYGEPVVFTRDASGVWHGRDARTGYMVAPDEQGFVSWVDPVDGLTYVVFITDHFASGRSVMLRDGAGTLGAPGIWDMNTLDPSTPFVGELAIFTSTDGLVHIVGRSAGGDLVMMSRNNVDMADSAAWSFTNITTDHLQFQGQSTPDWIATPVTYVTPWNAFTIAGLNALGEVETVWIAPGMTLWRTDNLSTISDAPALVGGITAFTTAWGGVNIVGTPASGDLTAIWWAPALGGEWRTDNLSDAAGSSIRLRSETLTSYVQPWGAMNIAGIDENGGVTIFWWTLTTGAWIASTVATDPSTTPLPVGPLSSGVEADGSVHLGGVSELGDVIDLSWEAGMPWTLTDLTETAV